MTTIFYSIIAALLFAGLGGLPAAAQETKQRIKSVKENTQKVQALNAFFDDLMRVHRYRLETRKINKSERIGGYKDMPEHYREVEYRDAKNDHLLSRIRWENKKPGLAEMVEIYIYDKQGRLNVDYLANYVPGYRNAPYQVLVNIHNSDDSLTAFRQFDTFGDRLFERCKGDFFDQTVDLSLDEIDIPPDPSEVSGELYTACFGLLPITPDRYLKPMTLIPGLKQESRQKDEAASELSAEALEQRMTDLDRRIKASPDQSDLYVKRGRNYLWMQQFDNAISDFTKAINLNDNLDAAYFGRGMAYGRNRQLDRGIEDLSVFIRRNPESSLAYTKRGVRYIWKKDFKRARQDLEMAVSLDDTNAEAYDDLGVVLAQQGNPEEAIGHFLRSKTLDPSYQKAYHNLAIVLYMLGDLERALPAVNGALRLQPKNRGSLLVKSNILEGLGQKREAAAIRESAEFLTEGNWSERSAIR
ncbi:MAG: tetratricopeptide repeat protein [Rhodospirillales bacterium]|nr:tetratricopeptide repeat protein [Rhodospirillales bacterium]